jgi:NAD(P)-dependent dehydrogenase (short-subunit alcohol dehydrogenase family)
MPKSLVFVTGASSGIGRAIAESRPDSGARLIDISRRGLAGVEHFAADLADPSAWPGVAELFDREIAAFDGDRVVFFHNAGTLHPMGFAGEVETGAYTRNVLLNSAAPQVLGHAFLCAAAKTRARAYLVCISSGAARSIYEGWSSYGAGKAAVDQWVRIAGAEQERRGGRCRVLSVAPGVVATEMQQQIREMPAESFPEVDKFIALHEEGVLRDPDEVAVELWALLDRDLVNGTVLDLRDAAD